jgi:hypothetical protein
MNTYVSGVANARLSRPREARRRDLPAIGEGLRPGRPTTVCAREGSLERGSLENRTSLSLGAAGHLTRSPRLAHHRSFVSESTLRRRAIDRA